LIVMGECKRCDRDRNGWRALQRVGGQGSDLVIVRLPVVDDQVTKTCRCHGGALRSERPAAVEGAVDTIAAKTWIAVSVPMQDDAKASRTADESGGRIDREEALSSRNQEQETANQRSVHSRFGLNWGPSY
jgi:hypothetical protein